MINMRKESEKRRSRKKDSKTSFSDVAKKRYSSLDTDELRKKKKRSKLFILAGTSIFILSMIMILILSSLEKLAIGEIVNSLTFPLIFLVGLVLMKTFDYKLTEKEIQRRKEE